MSLPIDYAKALSAVDAAVDQVQGYQGSQITRDVATLFDALVEYYRVQLTECLPEDLNKLQAAHKQCVFLRAALVKDGDRPTIL